MLFHTELLLWAKILQCFGLGGAVWANSGDGLKREALSCKKAQPGLDVRDVLIVVRKSKNFRTSSLAFCLLDMADRMHDFDYTVLVDIRFGVQHRLTIILSDK